MDIQQFYYVLEVARQKSFSKAAEALYVSQPTISRRISALEKELQVKLFQRDTHTVSLTPSGEEFCTYAADITQSIDAMLEHFNLENPVQQPVLRIGVFPFYKMSPLRQVISSYLAENKNVALNITVIDTLPAYDMLENGQLDFAFVKEQGDGNRNLRFIELARENAYLLVRHGSENSSGELTTDDLSRYRILIGQKNSRSNNYAKKYLSQMGVMISEAAHDTSDADIILDMVRSSDTNVLVSESIARHCTDDTIDAMRVSSDIQVSTFLVCSRERTPRGTAADFCRYVQEAFSALDK